MERAAAAPQACAAAISTVMDKVRQKVENSNDLDLSDESSSINLETLSAFMQGDGRTILDNALRRFADDQSSLASRGVAAIKRGAEEIDKPKEENRTPQLYGTRLPSTSRMMTHAPSNRKIKREHLQRQTKMIYHLTPTTVVHSISL